MKIGTKVKAKRFIRFIDGSFHKKGQIITIDKESISYFRVMQNDYDIVKE